VLDVVGSHCLWMIFVVVFSSSQIRNKWKRSLEKRRRPRLSDFEKSPLPRPFPLKCPLSFEGNYSKVIGGGLDGRLCRRGPGGSCFLIT